MTRDESVALFLQGKDVWNAWAKQMLAERKALKDAGTWASKRNTFGTLKPQNDDTREWMTRATADFSCCLFVLRTADGTKKTAEEDKAKQEACQLPAKILTPWRNLGSQVKLQALSTFEAGFSHSVEKSRELPRRIEDRLLNPRH